MDRFLEPSGELTVEIPGRDSGNVAAGVSMVAVLAACLALMNEESTPTSGGRAAEVPGVSKGMPAWKRAALTELTNAGVEIKDFI